MLRWIINQQMKTIQKESGFSQGSSKLRHLSEEHRFLTEENNGRENRIVIKMDEVIDEREELVLESESIAESESIPELSSIITGNIRGINPGIHSSKIDQIKDLAIDKESFLITLTESHLSDGIGDNELHMDGWMISRSDRYGRYGGGVLTMIKDNLTVADEYSGSDGMTE